MEDIIINNINYSNIRRSLSDARLSAYHDFIMTYLPMEFILFPYLSIQSVTAMFYPTLQLLEVCLRNHIYNSVTEYYTGRSKTIQLPGAPGKWLEWMPEDAKTKSKIAEAISKAQNEIKNRPILPDDIVARLNFGVWVRLLEERKFNTDPLHFWQGIAGTAFPNTQKSKRDIIESLKKANTLRNRIFHHEPAWKKKDVKDIDSIHKRLCQLHDGILDIINWMSPDIIAFYAGTPWDYKKRFDDTALHTFNVAKAASQIPTQKPIL